MCGGLLLNRITHKGFERTSVCLSCNVTLDDFCIVIVFLKLEWDLDIQDDMSKLIDLYPNSMLLEDYSFFFKAKFLLVNCKILN